MIGGMPKTAKNRRLWLPSIGDDLAVTDFGLGLHGRLKQAKGARSRLSVSLKHDPCKGKEPDKWEPLPKFIIRVPDNCF